MARTEAIFPRRLRREIIAVVALKLAALVAIHQLFFAAHDRIEISPQTAEARILSAAPAASPHGE